MTAIVAAHPLLALVVLLVVLAIALAALVKWVVIPLCDKPEGTHRAARPGRDGLDAEDAAKVRFFQSIRGLRHPGWTAFALRAQIAALGAIAAAAHLASKPGPQLWYCIFCEQDTPNGGQCPACAHPTCATCGHCVDEVDYSTHPPTNVPGVAVLDEAPASGPAATLGTPDVPGREMGSAPWPAPTPAGDTPSAAMVAGETPAQAPVEPHETAALGAQLPNRGDAQGRDGGCAPPEPRPAPGADLTGSLSPRPLQERPGPVSAPPDPGTPQPRAAGVEPGPEPGTPPAGVRDPVPAAARQWAIGELTGQHGPADTGAFPKVTGVA